jgi:hypothetical protein
MNKVEALALFCESIRLYPSTDATELTPGCLAYQASAREERLPVRSRLAASGITTAPNR